MYYSYFYKVENKKAYRTANDSYWLAKTYDNVYLFTEDNLEKAANRAISNSEDIPNIPFRYKTKKPYISFVFGFFSCLLFCAFAWLLFK